MAEAIEWDEDGVTVFRDPKGSERERTVSVDERNGRVFVNDVDGFLYPDQARAIAARLVVCANEADGVAARLDAEVVERVAVALYEAQGCRYWEERTENAKSTWRDQARAALAAGGTQ